MAKKKQSVIGETLLQMEPLLFEMVEQGLQKGDILALINVWIDVHAPSCVEKYDDGSGSPVFYYGAKPYET